MPSFHRLVLVELCSRILFHNSLSLLCWSLFREGYQVRQRHPSCTWRQVFICCALVHGLLFGEVQFAESRFLLRLWLRTVREYLTILAGQQQWLARIVFQKVLSLVSAFPKYFGCDALACSDVIRILYRHVQTIRELPFLFRPFKLFQVVQLSFAFQGLWRVVLGPFSLQS